jgi:hypothetical protein
MMPTFYIATTFLSGHTPQSRFRPGRRSPSDAASPYEVGKPVPGGEFPVTVLRSKHSPGTVGGDDTPIARPLSQPAGALDYFEGGSFDVSSSSERGEPRR